MCSAGPFHTQCALVFHCRALQDHSRLSALTYAHPEICTGSAFSGDSHNAMLSGPVWKQFTFEIPVRI